MANFALSNSRRNSGAGPRNSWRIRTRPPGSLPSAGRQAEGRPARGDGQPARGASSDRFTSAPSGSLRTIYAASRRKPWSPRPLHHGIGAVHHLDVKVSGAKETCVPSASISTLARSEWCCAVPPRPGQLQKRAASIESFIHLPLPAPETGYADILAFAGAQTLRAT